MYYYKRALRIFHAENINFQFVTYYGTLEYKTFFHTTIILAN